MRPAPTIRSNYIRNNQSENQINNESDNQRPARNKYAKPLMIMGGVIAAGAIAVTAGLLFTGIIAVTAVFTLPLTISVIGVGLLMLGTGIVLTCLKSKKEDSSELTQREVTQENQIDRDNFDDDHYQLDTYGTRFRKIKRSSIYLPHNEDVFNSEDVFIFTEEMLPPTDENALDINEDSQFIEPAIEEDSLSTSSEESELDINEEESASDLGDEYELVNLSPIEFYIEESASNFGDDEDEDNELFSLSPIEMGEESASDFDEYDELFSTSPTGDENDPPIYDGENALIISEHGLSSVFPICTNAKLYCQKHNIPEQHAISVHNLFKQLYMDKTGSCNIEKLPSPERLYLHRAAPTKSLNINPNGQCIIKNSIYPNMRVHDNFSTDSTGRFYSSCDNSRLPGKGGIGFFGSILPFIATPYKDTHNNPKKRRENILKNFRGNRPDLPKDQLFPPQKNELTYLRVDLATILNSDGKIYLNTNLGYTRNRVAFVSLPTKESELVVKILPPELLSTLEEDKHKKMYCASLCY